MVTILRALRHRPFAVLWAGQTISRTGDYLYQFALAWWVLETTGSATAMASVLIFSFAPMILFLLVGGAAVDRLPRVPLMLASDGGRLLIGGLVAALAFAGSLQIWHVYVASLLFGFVDAFFQPAYMAMVPDLVPAEDLTSANALTSFGVQGGRVLGPAIGAALIGLGGTPLAFALDAGSFGISALCLLPLLGRRQPSAAAPEAPASIFQDIRQGIGTVVGTPWLWITILVFTLTNVTLAGPFNVALPFLVNDRFSGNVTYLGWLYAAFPVGYVLGGLWLGRQRTVRQRGWLVYGGIAIAGLGMASLGLPLPIGALLAAAVFNGAALEISGQIWINLLQERIPGHLLGRVSSIDMMGSYVLLPLGYALAGWTTNAWGAATVCLVGGGLTMAVAAVALGHPAVRALS
ncbi:MAG TPA: MFS transporter [Herpetosiphonaceae bacterium]|nr:MFS transporter [Herpetosiphonaceae bacterium]